MAGRAPAPTPPGLGSRWGQAAVQVRSVAETPGDHTVVSVSDQPDDPCRDNEVANHSLLRGLIRAMRPRQWVKNVLVFAAPVAAGEALQLRAMTLAMLAFVLYSAAASGTYLLNDAQDVEADHQHPKKRLRPIAAGIVPVRMAVLFGVALLGTAIAGGFAVSTGLGTLLSVYVAITIAYTYRLKHVAVIELGVLASGFVLRAIAGGAATGTAISSWFLVVISGASMMMATGKRSSELIHGGKHRKVLDEYTASFLSSVRAASLAVALTAYCMWAFDDFAGDTSPIRLSVVPFSLALLRFTQLAEAGKTGEPEKVMLSDRTIITLAAGWMLLFGLSLAGIGAAP